MKNDLIPDTAVPNVSFELQTLLQDLNVVCGDSSLNYDCIVFGCVVQLSKTLYLPYHCIMLYCMCACFDSFVNVGNTLMCQWLFYIDDS